MAAGAAIPPDDQALNNLTPPSLPGIQGAPAPATPTAPPGPAASPSQPAAPGAAPLQGPPKPGIEAGATGQKGEIPTPDAELKFKDPDKLKKAQTTLDILNAATTASRSQYMAWWEKQHGAIDDKYDNLKQQLGARPSEEEPQTKKEKFAALLEFGLHLMKASAAPSTNQGAALTDTVADSIQKAQAAPGQKLAASQDAYDTQAAAIETARNKAQAGIGGPAAAQKAADDMAKTTSAATKDQAAALRDINDVDTTKAAAMGPATYATDAKGIVHSITRGDDGQAKAQPVTGIDGKPFTGRILGRATGSGVDKGDPAAVRTFKYATGVQGYSTDDAKAILGIKSTGKPDADHLSVYNNALRVNGGDHEAADRIADQYVLNKYGAGALARQNSPQLPQGQGPPPAAFNGVKANQVLDFGPNGRWAMGIDGKPHRVTSGPQTIQ